jgi:hypothetical protein
MNTRHFTHAIAACLLACSQLANSAERLSLGVKLVGAGWEGDNGSSLTDFTSDRGGQVGFNVSYAVDRFYAGLNLQGGDYDFNGRGPDQFNTTGRVPVSNVRVQQNDFDLLLGYYVWPQVSLFADIKAVGNRWSNNGYEQNFSGLGLGISGYIPQSDRWTLFGSLGFIGNGKIKDSNQNVVGDGISTAVEGGAVYKLDDSNHLNMGVKFRQYAFEHLNGSKQDYSVNALFFGFTHTFTLD